MTTTATAAVPSAELLRSLGVPETVGAFIDGSRADGGGDQLAVEDPATEETLAHLQEATDGTVQQAVESAATAARAWAATPGAERGRVLVAMAQALRRDGERLAQIESVDTGKPLSQARRDVEVSAQYFEYFAGLADKVTGTYLPPSEGTWGYTSREPYGVVAHITPWNSPLNQMSRGVAPCLAVGNAVVVKPSEITPLSTVAAAELFVQAGLPAGLLNVVLGRGPSTGARLVGDPRVGHVTFTGSVRTGKAILAAAAQRVVGCNLELGGKSPTIVMPDADLDAAARAGAMAVLRNSGQSCFATTRMVVHVDVVDRFVEKVCATVGDYRVGRGLDDPDLGPLVSGPHLAKVIGMVEEAVRQGAVLATTGAARPDRTGHFLQPIVLRSPSNDLTVAREEVFGPVQTVLTFTDEDEAVALANDSTYGLAAGVFTRDLATAHRLARRLEAGHIQVNRYPMSRVDAPFGGYKQSGIGREKGEQALDAYTRLKTVLVSD
jgi:aldehyde dehydrogenase (NAD+)